MGCGGSAEQHKTPQEVDAMPEGPDKEAAKQTLRQREAEETAHRLRQLGINLPADIFHIDDAEALRQKINSLEAQLVEAKTQFNKLGSYNVTVKLQGCDDLQQCIQANEAIVVLKLRLYDHPPSGVTVPPPTVLRLTLGLSLIHI